MSELPMSHGLPTDRYRSQNHEIREIIKEIETVMGCLGAPDAFEACARLVLAVNRKLAVHMQIENICMYSKLDSSLNWAEKRTIGSCREDLSRCRADFGEWTLRWSATELGTEERIALIQQARPILERLRAGLLREIDAVFPLVDELGWSALTGVN
jgi:vacuolar-type H+-ATPase subunit D/Vma8